LRRSGTVLSAVVPADAGISSSSALTLLGRRGSRVEARDDEGA
jgi:hypothetical protein